MKENQFEDSLVNKISALKDNQARLAELKAEIKDLENNDALLNELLIRDVGRVIEYIKERIEDIDNKPFKLIQTILGTSVKSAAENVPDAQEINSSRLLVGELLEFDINDQSAQNGMRRLSINELRKESTDFANAINELLENAFDEIDFAEESFQG